MVADHAHVVCFVRDRKEEFPKASEHAKFSCSVTDVFSLLNQGLSVIQRLDCQQPDVKKFSICTYF